MSLNKGSFNRVLAIDFETANSNNNTACSIGFALLEDGEIILNREILINPESHFSDGNIAIHNITPEMVKDKDTFPVVWNEVSKLINDNTLVIAHNTSADMVILSKLAAKYNIKIDKFSYLCTMEAYKKNGLVSRYGLKSIADELGISFEHHNAKEDALVCLKIFTNLLKDKKIITMEFLEKDLKLEIKNFSIREEDKPFKRKFFKQNTFKASDLTTLNTEFDVEHPAYKKIFVTTGDFVKVDKKVAAQRVVDLGGIFKDGFVKATDYLVVGLNEYKEPSINTTKYTKAMEKLNKGGEIKIINEDEFIKLLDLNVDIVTNNEEKEIEISKSIEEDNYIKNKNIEEKNRTNIVENSEQLSFDLLIKDNKKDNNIDNIEEEIAISKLGKEKYIKPKEGWITFNSIEEKLEKLKEYKLLSPKATDADKKFYYKGLYTNKAVQCSILEYLDIDVLVIEIKGKLHSIRGEYLKQMQDTNFNRFDSLIEK